MTMYGINSRQAEKYSDFKAVKYLLVINTAVFIFINIFPAFDWFSHFGLVPAEIFAQFKVWQLVTYLFLHQGLWHLVINMLMLWMFGSVIENIWGSRQFLFFYFFCGAGAGLCSFLFSGSSFMPVVGASGAIFGILVAYALMFPDNIILLFLIFPMKMRHAILVLAGINLLGAVSASGGGIAYFAHLGGGLFGYLYLRGEHLKRKFAYGNIFKNRKYSRSKKTPQRDNPPAELDKEVDVILDKISRNGINSLSDGERKILELKSRMK
ncbi:MAG: rhomboid family intramembrane serine protease [Candidatus Omnitrophica bacterium]|nr:rhomboid family intramembrane serine protease [Candidatus Omnitrophota bacterium]